MDFRTVAPNRPPLPPAATTARDQGIALLKKGRISDALPLLQEAVMQTPDDVTALFHLAEAARILDMADTAVRFYQRILSIEPGRKEVIVNLANTLRTLGDTAEALALLKSAAQADPDVPEYWLGLGNLMREQNDRTNARLFFDEALRLKRNYPEAHGNLGDLFAEEGDTEKAFHHYRAAFKRAPKNAQLRVNRSFLLLQTGDLRQGWREYEWRLKIEPELAYKHGVKRWRGGPLGGKTLLVCAEQGIGDQIQFASLIPDLIALAAQEKIKLILECEPRLLALMKRSFPQVPIYPYDLVEQDGQRQMHYDWLADAGGADAAIEIGSLCSYLRPELKNFPDEPSYLTPDPDRAAHSKNWLASLGAGPRVGVCWRSGKIRGIRNWQYAPPELWADLIRRSDATFVCVQYDAQPDEIENLERLSGKTIHTPPEIDQKQDIDGATALLSCLEAVLTAPTAVAYQAAAVGTPTVRLTPLPWWTCFGGDRDRFAPSCLTINRASDASWDSLADPATKALNRILIAAHRPQTT